MRRGRLLAARRAALVVALALSLCTAGQAASPSAAKAQTKTSRAQQLAVGAGHVCFLASGAAFCWGPNFNGEVGDGTTTSRPEPVPVTTAGTPMADKTLAEITAGYTFTCALDSDGAAYCWGYNGSGRLGCGTVGPPSCPYVGGSSSVPVAVQMPANPSSPGTTLTFTAISAAPLGQHVCALDNTGHAWCWGTNDTGQLGDGSTTYRPSPVEVTGMPAGTVLTQIDAGGLNNTGSTCALDETGRAWCWGLNASGQLGCGTITGCPSPTGTPNYSTVAVEVDTTGLPPLEQITVGSGFACAQGNIGPAWCWGANDRNQLGCGPASSTCGATSNVPVEVSQGELPAGEMITQITAGYNFACALSAGKAYCWGAGEAGQLGEGMWTTTSNHPIAVYAAIPSPAYPPYPGYPYTEWPDPVLSGKTLVEIDAGNRFACAMDTAGNVYCWGSNDFGSTIGVDGVAASPLPVLVFAAPEVVGVLSITVPVEATLQNSVAPGNPITPGDTASGQLDTVSVEDSRGPSSGWTVNVWISENFTSDGHTSPAAGNARYTAGLGTTEPAVTDHTPITLSTSPQAAVSTTGTNVSVSWNPTISVAVPRTAVIGTYTATIIHSVT